MGIIEKIVVSDETLRALEQSAWSHGRTVEQEAAEALRVATRPSAAELLARADAIAAMTPKGVEQTDSVILLREDRDR